MRAKSSLFAKSPFTTGRTSLRLRNTLASRSNRNYAFRWFLSGPWQEKQRSAKIGRTSRLNSITSGNGFAEFGVHAAR